jgi:hypothetical protein
MKYLSSTSRNLVAQDHAWDSIVHQFGRALLDSELNLSQDILQQRIDLPSGVLSAQPVSPSLGEFVYTPPYLGEYPNKTLNPDFVANTLYVRRFIANVNGMRVDVKGTNSTDPSLNLVTLSEPEEAGSLVDFVFLEVWRKEVTPAMTARGRIRLTSPLDGDTITFNNSVTLTVGTDFDLSLSSPETARNLAAAINDYDGVGLGMTIGSVTLTAETKGTRYVFLVATGGSLGNYPNYVISSSTSEMVVIEQLSGGSDGEGKPDADHVYYSGNLDSHPSLWLSDDIQDPRLEVSTSRRVQVQYRLRAHPMFNYAPSNEIFGFEHFSLGAQGPLANPVINERFTRHQTDNGLWVSGDGSEAYASTFGVVDGYIYAIPVALVFRRNKPLNTTGGFHALDRFNTGALHDHDGNTLAGNIYVDNVPATLSDRPDGYFSDEVAPEDVLDLRRRVFPQGLDFKSELDYQYHSLLDGQNKTWIATAHDLEDTGNGTAGISTRPLMCDAFGLQNNVLNIGKHKRDFDHIARRFSNAPVVERFFIPLYTLSSTGVDNNVEGVTYTQANVGQVGLHAGDTFTIDLDNLNARGRYDWSFNFPVQLAPSSIFPQGTKVIDLGLCWHDDGHYTDQVDTMVQLDYVRGLGTNQIEIKLSSNEQLCNGGYSNSGDPDYPLVPSNSLTQGSLRQINVEVIVEYPSGDYGLSAPVSKKPLGDDGVYPTDPNIIVGGYPESAEDIAVGVGNDRPPAIVNLKEQSQEVTLEYVYNKVDVGIVSTSGSYTHLPFRVYGDTSTITIEDYSDPLNPVPLTLDVANSNFSHAEPKLAWVETWAQGHRNLRVQAHPVVPFHSEGAGALSGSGSTVFVFYHREAPQTCGVDFPLAQSAISSSQGGVVPVDLQVEVLATGEKISAFMKSEETYPFYQPMLHLGSSPDVPSYQEYLLLNSKEVFMDDVGINTGFIESSTLLPIPSSVSLTLGSTLSPPVKDAGGRAVYPSMKEGTYSPSTFSKNLSHFTRDFKTAVPCLVKVSSDTHDLYRKGEVLLVVFVKTHTWGRSLSVDMKTSNNQVVACVYRTRNLLLLGE